MKKVLFILFVASGSLLARGVSSHPAGATTIVFENRTDFLLATGATPTTALPNLGLIPGGSAARQTVGDLTFSIEILPSSNELFIGSAGEPALGGQPWTSRLPGNHIAISGLENLNVDIASPVFSFGFDFVEPENDPFIHAPFIDSTFGVILLNEGLSVASFTFNAPDDTAAFIGVWTSSPFQRVEIREIVGGAENEFFGQFYTGITPVPEPGTLILLGSGLAGLVGVVWRRHRRK